jgi:hypothetical protein
MSDDDQQKPDEVEEYELARLRARTQFFRLMTIFGVILGETLLLFVGLGVVFMLESLIAESLVITAAGQRIPLFLTVKAVFAFEILKTIVVAYYRGGPEFIVRENDES